MTDAPPAHGRISVPAPRGGDGRRSAAAERRRQREALIIRATRELFDARGVRDAQIEDVARAVGVNRAIIYRHFTGKEELFALTQVDYLKDLHVALEEADSPALDPEQRLRRLLSAFVDFGLTHPAFVDCGVTILRMGPELLDEISPSALFRLGRGMTDCLRLVRTVVAEGQAAGVFGPEDPDLVASLQYSTALGGLQLARVGITVRESAPGVPIVVPVDVDLVCRHLVESGVGLARRGATG